jgi:hypothetical protein
MARERHGHGMLCVNPPLKSFVHSSLSRAVFFHFLVSNILGEKLSATQISKNTDIFSSHLLSNLETSVVLTQWLTKPLSCMPDDRITEVRIPATAEMSVRLVQTGSGLTQILR